MWKFAITALFLAAAPVSAQMPDTLAEAEIAPGWREGNTHVAGLTIRLAPGWKTYWRAPGDAGIPPGFNWSGSSNVAGVRVQFPVPSVFTQSGIFLRAISNPPSHPRGYAVERGVSNVAIRRGSRGASEQLTLRRLLSVARSLRPTARMRGSSSLLPSRWDPA